jgi:uncharacterized membrane protein
MATITSPPPRAKPLSPDRYERILALGATLLLAAVVVALMKGRSEWHLIAPKVWAHLTTIMVALSLTPVMMLRRRGDPLHRKLGWVWVVAMVATALLSFAIRDSNRGNFSFIHILSAWVLIQVPLIVRAARNHDVASHRTRVRAMTTGALLVAGFFTFPFNRLLGHWLMG